MTKLRVTALVCYEINFMPLTVNASALNDGLK
jgi:hypothetical protein